mmetsp:Transcript_78962/g.189570  ORF Transcript_78962/g.189570 Transcript_78962/m.189570 type:complete len:420 (-) Transcript_78962:72-1331(-)
MRAAQLWAELLLILQLYEGHAEPLGESRWAAAEAGENYTNPALGGSTTTETRTTTYSPSTVTELWISEDVNTTTVTTTVTTEFSCRPPAMNSGELVEYTSCVKNNCQEMSSDVMHEASGGRITNCFLLLEAAGGCAGDASSEVTALSNLGLRFQVGDLCGPLCPLYCQADATTSWQSRPSETTSAGTSDTSQEAPAEDGFEEELDTSTSQSTLPSTTLDLVASAGRLRVLISRLMFRVSSPERFSIQMGITKALRDGIAASLVVSPAQVVILSVDMPTSEGKATSESKAGHFRRLQGPESGQISVPFEILNAPHFLDARLLLDPATADAMEVHLKQLFVVAGAAAISDVRLEEPQVIFREVTKKETTIDEWFFTYPVDTKIGDHLEPVEPGIASNNTGQAAFGFAGLVVLCTWLWDLLH